MLSNYVLLAWRNLTANKTVSFINIFGLSIAVACCITVFLFLRNYWSLDSFHANGERIFMVEYQTEMDGLAQTWGDAPAPIAPAMAADFPQVERSIRVRREGGIVSSGEHTFEEVLTYADTGFFGMFSFPLIQGNGTALSDPAAIILSTEMAEKYFKGEMPIGRALALTVGNQGKKIFTVQGVAGPFPNNCGFRFDLLTGYRPAQIGQATEDWSVRTEGVFLQLRQPSDAHWLAGQMNRYLPLFNAQNTETPATTFVLDNLRHPNAQAYDVIRRPAEAHHPALTFLFSGIALLLMALSCFNYVNISLGAASRRLKEIGVRKVMGGNRGQLVGQFMAENLLLCFCALLLGLLFCQLVFVPMLNDIMVMKIGLALAQNTDLWGFLAGLLIFTALVSGAYPALYVSALRPTAIFSGKQKFGGKSAFRRGLLTAQFALAFLAVIVSVVLLSAGKYWTKMAWGYDPGQTWVVQLTDSTQFSLLKNELLKNPNVQNVAGASQHIGLNINSETLQIGEEKMEARRFDVGAGYFEALGLTLTSGRFFNTNRRVEDEQSVIINESFVKKQGWSDALGQRVRVGEKYYAVAGVLKDFKIFGTGAVNPAVFFRAADTDFSYLLARFTPGSGKQVADQAVRGYQGLFASAPINHFFQNEVFDGFNRTFWGLSKSFGYIAALALLIACLGLYGLATQQFARRMKEVGVRKLLGASVGQIVLFVNREFVLLLCIAGGISTVLGLVGAHLIFSNLEHYTGTYQPGIMPFILANALVFATAAVAIGRQSWQLAQARLAEVLKNNE